jgi:hypothetical protein
MHSILQKVLPGVLAVALELPDQVGALAVVLARLRFALVDVQLTELALVALGADAGGQLRVALRPVGAFLQLAERLLAVETLVAVTAVAREVVIGMNTYKSLTIL